MDIRQFVDNITIQNTRSWSINTEESCPEVV